MPECARAAIRLEACRANWLAADLRADAKALYAAMGTMRYTYGKPRGITLYPMYDPQHRAGRRITPTIVAQFRANAARYQTAADILFAMSR